MMYIIPKKFNSDWDRMINYVETLNSLEIKYNPKKSLFPRLKDTDKRGKCAVEEILKKLNSYFISKKGWLEELFFILKNNIKKYIYKYFVFSY